MGKSKRTVWYDNGKEGRLSNGILVIGSINIDMVMLAPRIPGPCENVCGAGFVMVPGGKGANQAVAACRLGARTLIYGRVGDDYFGRFLLESIAAAGVDSSRVAASGSKHTGVALIVVEETSGNNTIVVDPGANMTLVPDDLDAVGDDLGHCAAALFQLEIPTEVAVEGARRARAKGVTTILDAGPPRGITVEVAREFDIVSPNMQELSDICGEPVRDVTDAARAAGALLESGVRSVVVKMGGMGALLANEGGMEHVGAFRVKALDTTAAGDAFTAGLAVALEGGAPEREAVVFACAAGALATTVVGAQPSMPERGQVERLVRSQEIECTYL